MHHVLEEASLGGQGPASGLSVAPGGQSLGPSRGVQAVAFLRPSHSSPGLKLLTEVSGPLTHPTPSCLRASASSFPLPRRLFFPPVNGKAHPDPTPGQSTL